MKFVHRLLGILIAFCLMWILFITSIQAVVYWNPGYFEKEYTKYQVLDDLPPMTMEDLLDVTDEMMDYLKGDRADLHVVTTMGGETREFFNNREIAHCRWARVFLVLWNSTSLLKSSPATASFPRLHKYFNVPNSTVPGSSNTSP